WLLFRLTLRRLSRATGSRPPAAPGLGLGGPAVAPVSGRRSLLDAAETLTQGVHQVDDGRFFRLGRRNNLLSLYLCIDEFVDFFRVFVLVPPRVERFLGRGFDQRFRQSPLLGRHLRVMRVLF